jgi:hypothetical protein
MTDIQRAELNLTDEEKKTVMGIIELWLLTRDMSNSDMVVLFSLYIKKAVVDESLSMNCSGCRIQCREFWRQWFKNRVGVEYYLELTHQ